MKEQLKPAELHRMAVTEFLHRHPCDSNLQLYRNKKLYAEFKKTGHDKITFMYCKCSEGLKKTPFKHGRYKK